MSLTGKVALVTGAGAGIGESTALLLANEGAKVCCIDRNSSGQRVVENIRTQGGTAFFVPADVAEEAQVKILFHTTIENFGRLDVLCNIAGIVIPGRLDNTTLEDWDRTMQVNVRSVFLMSKYAYPHLKATQGVIVNTASSVASKGVKDRAVYTASKGAILSLTRAMAVDWIEDHIRVNSVSPGTTDTPSLQERLAKLPNPTQARIEYIARQPLGRLGKPEEIAQAILLLVTNTFMTGTNIGVDGGMIM